MTKSKLVVVIFLSNFMLCFGQSTVQFADSIRRTSNIPELSYAVILGNSILEIQALGHHSIALNDTASLNDRFHIGSNTKALTAFVIAKYVEKNKLKWTTKFFDIFPEWKNKSNPAYYNISLQDLLSHRAKIQPFQGENDPVIPPLTETKQQKRTEFGKFVLTLEPVEIDSLNKFNYSNAGYTLATLMLEKVTGKTWEQLMEINLNEELNLNIKFSWPENQINKDTWGHITENNTLTPVPSTTDYHLDYTEPAGDISIKLLDYIKFIQLNLKGLGGDDNFIQSKTYKFIHKGIEHYSLGWFNSYENGKDYSTHSGTAGTYYSLVAIDRRSKIAFIVFTNSFNEDTVNGVRQLMRMLKSKYGS